MTNLYFVRHAKSDFSIEDELIRPLTEKGFKDSEKLLKLFKDISIDYFYSSPYVRSIDTIKPLAKQRDKEIIVREDLRERNIGMWLDDFFKFSKKQWDNFDYKIENGESLLETQRRNVSEINKILNKHKNENIVIGTHGTALCTIINYFQPEIGYDCFLSIVDKMPIILKVVFDGNEFKSFEEI
ncbi:MAG: histidine phosphatase family protein [Candidatus Delongbacteria bacterium]|jgi:2,3-bisphosphoglycerate-dependent phosphoglycerate mutase|nr:histidine phosphatase family protein [Candidatus Delongbacteria bacterium]